jgi:hypothetical protein
MMRRAPTQRRPFTNITGDTYWGYQIDGDLKIFKSVEALLKDLDHYARSCGSMFYVLDIGADGWRFTIPFGAPGNA